MITAQPLNQEVPRSSNPLLPIMLGVIGGSIVIGGLLASRRNGNTKAPHIVIGGLLVAGVAGTIYAVSRNGHSTKAIQRPQENPQLESRHYTNTKEWNITYNSDGLPIKIVKHVQAEIT